MCPLSHNPLARRVGDSNTTSNSVAARRTCTTEVSCPYRLACRLQNACKGRGGLNRFNLNVCHGLHMSFRRTAPRTIPTDPRPKGNRLTPTGGVPRKKTSAAPTSASVTRKRKTTAAQNVAVYDRPLHHMHSLISPSRRQLNGYQRSPARRPCGNKVSVEVNREDDDALLR